MVYIINSQNCPVEITRAVRGFGLTQEEADRRTGIQRMQRLNRLGYVIEIKVRPAKEPIGHLMLAIV